MSTETITTTEELAAGTIVATERNDALTKALFGRYGYTEFDLLPLKAQYAIEDVVARQWDMEDMIAAEGGVVGPGTTFGARLKAARLARGMTKAAAARAAGIQQGPYQAKERKVDCNLDTAMKLSAALNVSLDYLAGRSESLGAANPAAGPMQGTKGCGLRLEAARVAKGMTRGEVARMTGLTDPGIRRIEATDTCRLGSAAKLADELGVSLDYLAGMDESDQQRPELEAA